MFNLFEREGTDNFEFLIDQIGSDVSINEASTPTRAIVTNTNLEQNYDDRRISTMSPLNRGDIVIYNGKKYMVISEVNEKRYNKFKGIMRRLTHTIIVNSSCRFCALDSYVVNTNLGVSGGLVLSNVKGDMQVYTSQFNKESEVKIGDRFLLDGQAFKVTGIDSFSKPGIVILNCEMDQINPATDDVENHVAGGKACPVEILSNEPVVYVDETLQLTWTSAKDAPMIFESSESSVATVNATGIVSGHTVGEVIITIRNATNSFIFDTVTVRVEEVPVSKSIQLVFNEPDQQESNYYYMYANKTHTLTATVYEGATLTTGAVTFQIFADDKVSAPSASLYTGITNGNIYTITSKSAYGYLQLKVTLVSDPSVFVWQRIRIKGYF